MVGDSEFNTLHNNYYVWQWDSNTQLLNQLSLYKKKKNKHKYINQFLFIIFTSTKIIQKYLNKFLIFQNFKITNSI